MQVAPVPRRGPIVAGIVAIGSSKFKCRSGGMKGISDMTRTTLVAVAAAALALAGCGPDGPSKADTGLVGGAVLGGIVGSQFGGGSGRILGAAVGAFAGGIIGHDIGRKLDQRDRMLAQQAELDGLERGPSGRPVRWRNPDNGRYGDFVPLEPYRRGAYDCRDFTHTVYIDGRPQAMRGTACRNPDGTWRNVG
jgi:surface antigen